jgi:hypothetical protein
MRRVVVVVLVVTLVLTAAAPPAAACGECVALGLVSFAAFTLLAAALAPPVVYATPAYYAPGYYPWYGYPGAYGSVASYTVASYPVGYYPAYRATYSYVPAPTPVAWTGARVVQYPHGRYELRGDGLTVPYAWVWIPKATPPVTRPDGPEGGGARTP